MGVVFDTLAYAKELKAAGFTEQQAEVQARSLFRIIDEKLEEERRARAESVQTGSSCPALCRASTTSFASSIRDVDGRDKPGHDARWVTLGGSRSRLVDLDFAGTSERVLRRVTINLWLITAASVAFFAALVRLV